METSERVDVYLAAPFFSLAERLFNERLVERLEAASLSVFYAPRDAPLARDYWKAEWDPCALSKEIWSWDKSAIDRANLVLAVLDGRSTDEGVCVELGYAAGVRGTAVGVWTDARTEFEWGLNPVLRAVIVDMASTVDEAIVLACRYAGRE